MLLALIYVGPGWAADDKRARRRDASLRRRNHDLHFPPLQTEFNVDWTFRRFAGQETPERNLLRPAKLIPPCQCISAQLPISPGQLSIALISVPEARDLAVGRLAISTPRPIKAPAGTGPKNAPSDMLPNCTLGT